MVTAKFSKILVAVDGSESSMDAVDYAISITKKGSASLIAYMLCILQQDAYSDNILGFVTPSSIGNLLSFFFLQRAYSNYKIQLKTDLIVTPTSIVGAIIHYAEHEKADLIVIGTRGRSGIKKMLLGSVAAGVVTYAHCPVMVVK